MLQKIINLLINLVALSLPLYLVRFEICSLPTNLLELIILVLFIVWLVSKIQSGKSQFKETAFFYPIFLIFFGLTLATFFSTDLRISAGIWKGWFIVPWLYFVVLIDVLRSKKQVIRLLTALTLSGLGIALVAFGYWANNLLTYDGRLKALYLSPNHLAMFLSPILILSFYLYFCLKKNIHKIILFIVHCSLFAVIYLTYSYGAWLGLLAGFIFLSIIFYRKRTRLNRPKFIFSVLGLIFLIFVSVCLNQAPGQKFQGLVGLSYPSLESRLIIWQSAWTIIKDHPLLGIGPGLFQKYYLDYQSQALPYLEWAVPQPHNLFLAFWLQTGLLGLLGLLWLLVRFFRNFSRPGANSSLKPEIKKGSQLLKYFLLAAMIYLLVHGFIDTTYWKNDLSVIFWLLIALNYRAGRCAC